MNLDPQSLIDSLTEDQLKIFLDMCCKPGYHVRRWYLGERGWWLVKDDYSVGFGESYT
jgi:hypothetical protein